MCVDKCQQILMTKLKASYRTRQGDEKRILGCHVTPTCITSQAQDKTCNISKLIIT